MGTRHLIAVYNEGEYKVAQYGQWDGYPSGQGVDILRLLKQKNFIQNLKNNLNKVRFIDNIKDKEFIDLYNRNAPNWSNEPDNRTDEQKRWWSLYTSRNLGATVLSNISKTEDDEILLRDSIDFAGDSLFCEWAYVIDLDRQTFEVYEGFNQAELDKSERFYSSPRDHEEYEPVKLKRVFDLTWLPDEETFLLLTEPKDEY